MGELESKIKCTCHGKMQPIDKTVKVVFCLEALPASVVRPVENAVLITTSGKDPCDDDEV